MAHIYLDANATTPLLPAVWEAMRPYFDDTFGNPASAHRAGQRARQALEDARERLADLLDAHPDEVVLTSGGTESNNLALFSLVGTPPARIVCSRVEHPSVIEPLRNLQTSGFEVRWLDVDREGLVLPESFAAAMREEPRLLAIQLANHETGAVQPIADLARRTDAPLHCDAVQAVGKIPVRFHELGVATLSLSAHKFHGPKGIGALLARRGLRLRPLHWGGHQQQGRRPGTEPVPLVVGMVKALEIAHNEAARRREHITRQRDVFLAALRGVEPVVRNGPERGGLPGTLNLSFPGCSADVLLMSLDMADVACSTGSACSSGSLLPSPVLQAMGVPDDVLRSAMRFSFHALLTEEEVAEAGSCVAATVQRLRYSGN